MGNVNAPHVGMKLVSMRKINHKTECEANNYAAWNGTTVATYEATTAAQQPSNCMWKVGQVLRIGRTCTRVSAAWQRRLVKVVAYRVRRKDGYHDSSYRVRDVLTGKEVLVRSSDLHELEITDNV